METRLVQSSTVSNARWRYSFSTPYYLTSIDKFYEYSEAIIRTQGAGSQRRHRAPRQAVIYRDRAHVKLLCCIRFCWQCGKIALISACTRAGSFCCLSGYLQPWIHKHMIDLPPCIAWRLNLWMQIENCVDSVISLIYAFEEYSSEELFSVCCTLSMEWTPHWSLRASSDTVSFTCTYHTWQFIIFFFTIFTITTCIFSYSFSLSFWTLDLALRQIISSIDLFLFYWTDYTDSRTI